jgi:hypothetical protein
MEDRNQDLRQQHAGENVPPALCAPEREPWSTPVLIGLNAAGTENGGMPGGIEQGSYAS